MSTGVDQAVVDSVESQIFTYDVKLTNETGYSILTWKEILDQNSTRCEPWRLFSHVILTVQPEAYFAFSLYLLVQPLSANFSKTASCYVIIYNNISFVSFHFLPARRYASAGNSDRNVSVRLSVRPSVCPSVTRRYCVKTKKASGMVSSPSGSPKTLVLWRQISSPNSKGFPPNGGLKQGWVGKIQRFSSFKRQYLENGSRYGQSYY